MSISDFISIHYLLSSSCRLLVKKPHCKELLKKCLTQLLLSNVESDTTWSTLFLCAIYCNVYAHVTSQYNVTRQILRMLTRGRFTAAILFDVLQEVTLQCVCYVLQRADCRRSEVFHVDRRLLHLPRLRTCPRVVAETRGRNRRSDV